MHESTVITRREVLVGAAATAFIAAAPSSAIAAMRKKGRSQVPAQSTAMPLNRHMAASALLPDGRILVAGGYSHKWNDIGSPQALSSAVIFDPGKDQIIPIASMHVARARHAAVVLRDGRVAMLGGIGREPTASVEIYDPRTNIWKVATSLALPRFDHTAVSNGDAVFIVGGSTSCSVSAIEIIRPETGSTNSLRP